MLDLFNKIGNAFESFFTGIMEAKYENGIIYLTGRDFIAFVIGALTMMIFILIIIAIKDECRRNKKNGCKG